MFAFPVFLDADCSAVFCNESGYIDGVSKSVLAKNVAELSHAAAAVSADVFDAFNLGT